MLRFQFVMTLPRRRTKRLALGNGAHWRTKGIGRILPCDVAPPIELDATFGHLQYEKYEEDANSDASVETSREDVVVPHPPTEVISAHEPLEDKADEDPRGVVDSGCWGERPNACEKDRNVDVPPVGEGEATSKIIEWNRQDSTNEEEPEQRTVHSTRAE